MHFICVLYITNVYYFVLVEILCSIHVFALYVDVEFVFITIFGIKYDLGQKYYAPGLRTPSSTLLGFELMTSRSWQYISCHWDTCSNHSAISDPLQPYIYTCFNSLSASHDNWSTATLLNRVITAQWEGMGDVGSARYEPALLPPCPTIRVLCYSNCQRSTHSHQQFKG